jgi:pantetheine-phosphate adenylyltransferase
MEKYHTQKYHTQKNHIEPMLKDIDDLALNGINADYAIRILKFAAIFHDSVYSQLMKNGKNEIDSMELFMKVCKERNIELINQSDILILNKEYILNNYLKLDDIEIKAIAKIILNTIDTFNKRDDNILEHYFYLLDLKVLTQDFEQLVEYETQIFNEYKNLIPLKEYKQGRISFLEKVKENGVGNAKEIDKLIEYVKNKNYGSLGIFVGSFNPFTIGHKNILDQAEKHFDQMIVGQLHNPSKSASSYSLPKLNAFCVKSGLNLIEFLKEYGEGYDKITVIRGLRSSFDLNYEQNFRSLIKDFSNIDFVYFLCDVELQHISSSMVRSLDENHAKKYIVS